jgi:hypothetical protein
VHKQRSDCRAADYDREPNRHLRQGSEQYEGKKPFYVQAMSQPHFRSRFD